MRYALYYVPGRGLIGYSQVPISAWDIRMREFPAGDVFIATTRADQARFT